MTQNTNTVDNANDSTIAMKDMMTCSCSICKAFADLAMDPNGPRIDNPEPNTVSSTVLSITCTAIAMVNAANA